MAPEPAPATVEMPFTLRMRVSFAVALAVISLNSFRREPGNWMTFGIPTLSWLLAVAMLLISGRDVSISLLIWTLACLNTFVGMYAVAFIVWQKRDAWRNLLEDKYLCITGPMGVYGSEDWGHRVVVADRTLYVDRKQAVEACLSLSGFAKESRTVEHTKHGPIILEVRDAAGRCLYRLPGYAPDP